MASELNIYSLYRLQDKDKYYLLRTNRPGYSNVSEIQQNEAEDIEHNKRISLLKSIGKHYSTKDFEFIGEQQGFPIGDKLYLDSGNIELNIFYMNTEFGQPWIIIGNAASESEFLSELNSDEDLLSLKPVGKPRQVSAIFLIENE